MEHEDLFEKLKVILDGGKKKSQVEAELGMSKNSLSGYQSGSKVLPKKWIEPLTQYVEGTYKPMERIVVEKAAEIPVFEKGNMEKTQQSEISLITEVAPPAVQEPSVVVKKAALPIKDTQNDTFDTLLREFYVLVEGAPPVSTIKEALLALKSKAIASNINGRQKEAVATRCDNYILGNYGKSHNK